MISTPSPPFLKVCGLIVPGCALEWMVSAVSAEVTQGSADASAITSGRSVFMEASVERTWV
jgi:hypothetical protein